jgi:hypothetical protein
MGLDWNPGNRAKPGFEVEFADMVRRLIADPNGASSAALLARYRDISITAFETLGAPVVGRDPEADAWARQWRIDLQTEESEEEFLTSMAGFAVLDLVPASDGLPRYSNGSPGGYVEAYSFRAQFLKDSAEELGDLLGEAYESKLPDEFLEYGRRLLATAENLAHRHGLDPLTLTVPDEIPTFDEFAAGKRAPDTVSVEHRIDVIHSAGRWCVFWAERGHILDAYY